MGMTVKRRKDVRTPLVMVHKVADIRGGVSVSASELGGNYLREGSVLSAPVEGITHVVKLGKVTEKTEAEGTSIKIEKFHNFKTGDFILVELQGKASTILSIDSTAKGYDVVTVDKALGALEKGSYIVEAKAASEESGSELKYEPFALNGTGQEFDPKSNIATDAWIIGVTHNYALPSFIADKLKGIFNY